MSSSAIPFDDIRTLAANLPEADEKALQLVSRQIEDRSRDLGDMGKAAGITRWLAAWSGKSPAVTRPVVTLFAGTSAVLDRLGDALDANGKTCDLVADVTGGQAPINAICAANDLGLKIFDLALQLPVPDITGADALDEKSCAATMAFGMEAVSGGTDLLCLGSIGIGSSVSASAIISALYEEARAILHFPDLPGAGHQQSAQDLVGSALAFHQGHLSDPLEVLRRLGGREFSAIAGAVLAARVQHIPVILDGMTCLAAAAILKRLNQHAIDHCMVAQNAVGQFESWLLEELGLTCILDTGLQIGQGCAAGMAVPLVRNCADIIRPN